MGRSDKVLNETCWKSFAVNLYAYEVCFSEYRNKVGLYQLTYNLTLQGYIREVPDTF